MAVFHCLPVLIFLVITVLLACSACAADAGVQLGSDLGVAQQVNQVQKKLHDTQEKLEASEVRSDTLEKHAEAVEAELKAAKEAAEAKLNSLKERKVDEEEALSGRLNEALTKIEALEKEVAALSTSKGQLEMERTQLLKWAQDGKNAERTERKAKALEEENAKLLDRVEKAEHNEAEQRKLVTKLKKEAEGLREQASEAAEKLAKLEAALLQAQAELSAKEQVLSSWLPHWAAVKINPLQEAALVHWYKWGHPTYSQVSSKVSSGASRAHEWAKPHISLARSASVRAWEAVGQPAVGYAHETHQKYMPVVAAEWEEHVSPLVETAHSRAAAAYSRAATLAGPHAKRAQQGLATALHTLRAHPRYLALSAAAAPHLGKLREVLQPLTHAATVAWGAAKDLHHWAVQYTFDQLSAHQLTEAYATLNNARAVLYVLLALPAVFILATYPGVSKKVQSELFAAEEALAKKKRKMVPGKPGQGTLGRRPSGTSPNGTT